MVAIDPSNREKMINIIADILEISGDVSPLLRPLFERDTMLEKAESALANSRFEEALEYCEKIADLCFELGDDSLGNEFLKEAEKIRVILQEGDTSAIE